MAYINKYPDNGQVNPGESLKVKYDGLYDGDTVYVLATTESGKTQRLRVRMDAINAPELHQVDGGVPTGQLSTDNLKKYFADYGSDCTLTFSGKTDKYGRPVGYIKSDNADESANYVQLRDGYAWFYEGFGQKSLASQPGTLAKYQKAAADAKDPKNPKGIWTNPAGQDANIDPDIWRDMDEEKKSRAHIPIIIRVVAENNETIQKMTVFRGGKPMELLENVTTISSELQPGEKYVSFQIKADGSGGASFDTATVGVSRLEDEIVSKGKYETKVVLYRKNPKQDVVVTCTYGDEPIGGVQVSLGDQTQSTGGDGVASFSDVEEGSRNIIWKCANVDGGYADGSRAVTVSDASNEFEIALAKKGDKDSATITNKAAEKEATEPIAAQIAALNSMELPAVDPEEYDKTNTSYLNYYTCAQTRMYIGSLFIDEMLSVQWNLSENAVPVFGYSSRYFDALAEGRSLVQGQVTINYVAPWYLGMALVEWKKQAPADDVNPRYSEIEQLASILAQGGKMPDNIADFTPDELADAKDQVKQMAIERANELRGAGAYAYKEQPQAVYKNTLFNIVLEYGDRTKKNRRMLVNCKLTSCEQIVDPSGNPIAETYGFVAQKVI